MVVHLLARPPDILSIRTMMHLALARMLAPWPFTAIRIAGSGLALSIPASTASSVLLPGPARHQGFVNILSFDNVCQGGFEGIACTVTTEARTRRRVVKCMEAICRSQHNSSGTTEFMYV
jgi:hypothetical protein